MTDNETWLFNIGRDFGWEKLPNWPSSTRDEELWSEFSKKFGIEVPQLYREFVTVFGGGGFYSEDGTIAAPISEPCPWGGSVNFGVIYPLAPGDQDSIDRYTAGYAGRIPCGSVVFSSDAGGNELVLDVAGKFPGSVWFWDHEQRWFTHNIEAAAREVDAAGIDARRMDVHQIIRAWARLHEAEFDRPADYMGMYRIAPDFETFLKSLYKEPY